MKHVMCLCRRRSLRDRSPSRWARSQPWRQCRWSWSRSHASTRTALWLSWTSSPCTPAKSSPTTCASGGARYFIIACAVRQPSQGTASHTVTAPKLVTTPCRRCSRGMFAAQYCTLGADTTSLQNDLVCPAAPALGGRRTPPPTQRIQTTRRASGRCHWRCRTARSWAAWRPTSEALRRLAGC